MWQRGDAVDVFQLIAERKITEAIERGEFDNLPGKGHPLHFTDDPLVPPEVRLAYKILKNAGVEPLEISLRRELAQLKAEYNRARTPESRQSLMREIRLMTLRIAVMQKSVRRSEGHDMEV